MSRRPPRIDRSQVRTVPARRRKSKVAVRHEATPHTAGASFRAFLDQLPDLLGAADLRTVIAASARAHAGGRTLWWGLGAHVIKVGLAPIVVDLLERGLATGISMNGAGCVHDLELAMMGRTSEDVAESSLDDGSVRHGARDLRAAERRPSRAAPRKASGMGAAVGREILDGQRLSARGALGAGGGGATRACRPPCTSRSARTSTTCTRAPTVPPSARRAIATSRR